MNPLLTIADVAQKLNLKEKTIRKWVNEKKITYIKVGGAVRFREEWLDNWLNKHTIKSNSPHKN